MSPCHIGGKLFQHDMNPAPAINKFPPGLLIRWMMGLVVGFAFCTQILAAEVMSPRQWLEKMSSSMQELNYRGVFVYRSTDDLAAIKVVHLVDEQGVSELLETLTGDPRRDLRNTPHLNSVTAESSGQLGQIDSYYTLELMGSDRAAGRIAQLISVSPKDEFRYGYHLWLDQTTGLLLKSELLNRQGETLEQVMFTSLELIPTEQRDQLLEAEGMSIAKKSNTSSPPPDKLHWVIGEVPEGFVLLKSHADDARSNFEHIVYSDGLASVSVFVEKAKPEAEAFVGFSRMGAVSAFGRIESGYQVTVVGDVPEKTVKTIGQSFSIQEAAQ